MLLLVLPQMVQTLLFHILIKMTRTMSLTFLTPMTKIMLLILLNVKVLGKQECVDDSRFLVGGIHAAKQSTNFMLKPSSNTREEADHEHLLVRPGPTHHVREA